MTLRPVAEEAVRRAGLHGGDRARAARRARARKDPRAAVARLAGRARGLGALVAGAEVRDAALHRRQNLS